MAVRRCVTAGVAIAAVGAIAAAPAIAPPLQPRDVQVVNDVNMRLAADVRDLINTFFGESPGDSGGPGTIGFPGVFHQLLLNANVNDPRGTQVINSFFQNGTSDVVRLLLTRDNLDPVTVAQINTFFNSGMSDLVRLRLLMFNADPTQRAWINKFFGGAENDDGSTNVSQNGIPGVVYKFISERGLSPDQLRALNTFFNRGELQLGEQGNPVLDEWGEPIYFGNSNPAYRGFPGLAYNGLTDSGLSPDQQQTLDDLYDGGVSQVVRTRLLASTTDPNQIRDIIALFGDPNDSDAPYGLSENVRWRLIAGANGDQRSIDLTNELFDNGISGVVRYLLVGPVPELPESALVADEAVTFAAAASVDEPVDTTPVDPAPCGHHPGRRHRARRSEEGPGARRGRPRGPTRSGRQRPRTRPRSSPGTGAGTRAGRGSGVQRGRRRRRQGSDRGRTEVRQQGRGRSDPAPERHWWRWHGLGSDRPALEGLRQQDRLRRWRWRWRWRSRSCIAQRARHRWGNRRRRVRYLTG